MNKIKFIDFVIVVLFVLSVYFILTRIFGHSASDITITITLFGLLGSGLYKLNREFGEFKIKTIHSFSMIKNDLSLIKDKLKV